MAKINVYVGTYTNRESQGIYRCIFDTIRGVLDTPVLFYECQNPKCISVYQGAMITTIQSEHGAGIMWLDVNQPVPYYMDTIYQEEHTACDIKQDEDYIYTVNYHEGSCIVYRKDHGKLLVEKRIKLGDDAKCHQVFLLQGHMYVVCLGFDCIKILNPSSDYEQVGEIPFPKGSGPRQVVVDAKHEFLYALSELSNEVFVISLRSTIHGHCEQIVSLVPPRSINKNASAAIHLSADGKYLYTSTRGSDIITRLEIINGLLRIQDYSQCGGEHPRDFVIDETGRWLLVINRDSNNLVVFKIDPESGELIEITDDKKIPEGIAVVLQE